MSARASRLLLFTTISGALFTVLSLLCLVCGLVHFFSKFIVLSFWQV